MRSYEDAGWGDALEVFLSLLLGHYFLQPLLHLFLADSFREFAVSHEIYLSGKSLVTAGSGVRDVRFVSDSRSMSTVDYFLQVYSAVDSIAGELFEHSDEVGKQLEEEFGIDFYPLETEPGNKFEKDTANEYLRTGFGISSLLAEQYVKPQGNFLPEKISGLQRLRKRTRRPWKSGTDRASGPVREPIL